MDAPAAELERKINPDHYIAKTVKIQMFTCTYHSLVFILVVIAGARG